MRICLYPRGYIDVFRRLLSVPSVVMSFLLRLTHMHSVSKHSSLCFMLLFTVLVRAPSYLYISRRYYVE